MMKKVLALLLALLTVAAMSSCKKDKDNDNDDLGLIREQDITYDSWTDPATGGVFYFESIDTDTVKITGYSGPVKMHNVTIPTSVETGKDIYKTVTTIGEGAFRAKASIENLVIPDGITVIEPYAFERCVQMVSITLPSTLEVLGDGAFYQCGITSLTIPTSEKLTRIGSFAFFECDKLQEVTIPGNIKTVGEEAFRKCSGLKKVVLSEGVVTVETLGFYGCVSLEELELPSTFANEDPIEDLAFFGSDKLYSENVKIPEDAKLQEYKNLLNNYLVEAPVQNG